MLLQAPHPVQNTAPGPPREHPVQDTTQRSTYPLLDTVQMLMSKWWWCHHPAADPAESDDGEGWRGAPVRPYKKALKDKVLRKREVRRPPDPWTVANTVPGKLAPAEEEDAVRALWKTDPFFKKVAMLEAACKWYRWAKTVEHVAARRRQEVPLCCKLSYIIGMYNHEAVYVVAISILLVTPI